MNYFNHFFFLSCSTHHCNKDLSVLVVKLVDYLFKPKNHLKKKLIWVFLPVILKHTDKRKARTNELVGGGGRWLV